MVNWKNTENTYGLLAIVLHWVTAVGVIFLFSLGLWMDGLDYYDEYYRLAPHIHKSIGVLLISLVFFRLIWRLANKQPSSLPSHKNWEKISAKVTHGAFYALLICMLFSGYLITTAKGDSLWVFNWFALPATISGIANLEDYAGSIHKWIAYSLIGLALVHAAAALKHHFFDKDTTLLRMLGREKNTNSH